MQCYVTHNSTFSLSRETKFATPVAMINGNCLWQLWRGMVKVLLHLLTGQGELERVCRRKGYHTAHMSGEFAVSLLYSKELKSLSQSVFNLKSISVSGAVDVIVTKKRISTSNVEGQIVIANLAHCLHSLKFFNSCVEDLLALTTVSFDSGRVADIELIESFWSYMRPGVQRRGAPGSIVSEDWGEVGFQGSDPSTDFRGMGMLGLMQLEYFSRTKHREARDVLLNSQHPRRYYPFAATGINISAFVVELIRNRHLHYTVFKCLELNALQHAHDPNEGPSSSRKLLELGRNTVNDVYCDVFLCFDKLWAERDPQDVMSFPVIYDEVKSVMKIKYRQLI